MNGPGRMAVLAAHSQVLYGYAGLSAVTYPLQRLGLHAWWLPTCQLSNNPHYPTMSGRPLSGDELHAHWGALRDRGVDTGVAGALVGYLGDDGTEATLTEVMGAVGERASAPGKVCLDPFLGDWALGQVAPGTWIDVYRRLLGRADLATPNSFELSLLAGRPVNDLDAVFGAGRTLVRRHGCAVVTSFRGPGAPPDAVTTVVLTASDELTLHNPLVPERFVGTGDVFTATLLGHWVQGIPLGRAAGLAVDATYRLLRASTASGRSELDLPAFGDYQGIALSGEDIYWFPELRAP